jgi:hypothetical protein
LSELLDGKNLAILSATTLAAALLITPLSMVTSQRAYAATVTWDGGGDGFSFSDPPNWDTDTVPASTDSIVIGPADVTVSMDTDFTLDSAGSITVSGAGQLVIPAGKALVNSGEMTLDYSVDEDVTTPSILVSSLASFSNPGSILIANTGKNSTGIMNNGTFTNSGIVDIRSDNAKPNFGIYSIDGTMNNSGTINIQSTGFAGIVRFGVVDNSGTINIQNTNGIGMYATVNNTGTVMVENGGTNSGGIYAFTSGPIDNTGEMTVANTGTDTFGIVSAAFNIYGVVNVNPGSSIIAFNDPITVFCGGQLNNNGGTITGTVVNQNPCDTTPPVITILGANPATVELGHTYTDAGATVTDDIDASPTLTSTSTVNTAIVGTYAVTYTAEDDAGNTSTATRTVNVVNPVATITPNKDSFVTKDRNNVNDGANPNLQVRRTDTQRTLIAFNQTDIVQASQGKTLQSATLKMFITENSNSWGSGRTIELRLLKTDWTEGNGRYTLDGFRGTGSGVTWNCPTDTNIANNNKNCSSGWSGGSFVSAVTVKKTITNGLVGWVEFDVTKDVKSFLAGTNNYGWIIKKTQEDRSGHVFFASGEAVSNQPVLELRYS